MAFNCHSVHSIMVAKGRIMHGVAQRDNRQPSCITDSIAGVSLFADEAPDDFKEFNRAFIAMFRITAGETWVDSLPEQDQDGTINYQAATFIVSYIIIENWLLFQVMGFDITQSSTRTSNSRWLVANSSLSRRFLHSPIRDFISPNSAWWPFITKSGLHPFPGERCSAPRELRLHFHTNG